MPGCPEIVAAAVSLDDTFDQRGERVSLRWVLIHLVEEHTRSVHGKRTHRA